MVKALESWGDYRFLILSVVGVVVAYFGVQMISTSEEKNTETRRKEEDGNATPSDHGEPPSQ
jgi:uncharacterized membrane protein